MLSYIFFFFSVVKYCTHKKLAGSKLCSNCSALICANIIPTAAPSISFQWDKFCYCRGCQTLCGLAYNDPLPDCYAWKGSGDGHYYITVVLPPHEVAVNYI